MIVTGFFVPGKNLKTGRPTKMQNTSRLSRTFYTRDVLEVARDLIGKDLVVSGQDGISGRFEILETEAYRGEEDIACHASKGKTSRTEVMYREGGLVYMYFIYGMYWMMNIVAGERNNPQAVLIRAIEGYNGPGKLTRDLGIDGTFYGEDLTVSQRIWLEKIGRKCNIITGPRIGIDYAGEPWKSRPWRFVKK